MNDEKIRVWKKVIVVDLKLISRHSPTEGGKPRNIKDGK
jgi:hypothetical protein